MWLKQQEFESSLVCEDITESVQSRDEVLAGKGLLLLGEVGMRFLETTVYS